jgi:hypothetical protein
MFHHFTEMYANRTAKGPSSDNYLPVSLEKAGAAGCTDPDECKALS